MGFITFLVAVAALVLALLAYKRTGGTSQDLGKEFEKPLDTLRDKTADALSKIEKKVRKEDE